MGRLISTLLTGEAGMALELKKAGLCKLTVQEADLRPMRLPSLAAADAQATGAVGKE